MNTFSPPCPLASAPPFVAPWKRALPAEDQDRLAAWCQELLPGVSVAFVEWVGADPRQPLHAVVASFPSSRRPPLVVYRKVREIEQHHLAQAMDAGGAKIHRYTSTRADDIGQLPYYNGPHVVPLPGLRG